MQEKIRVSIVRGGTSKAIFIMEDTIPKDIKERDKVILKIFGSPDVRQIDGLGGADVLTSKLAIIGKNQDGRADIDYTFGQVSIDQPFIDYGGNCGNISSAVAGFAIDRGMIKAVEPVTEVKIRMINTNRILKAFIQVKDGKALVEGDYQIDGVPGTGAKIVMDWSDAAGGNTGHLLPTGRVKDEIVAQGRTYTVSVVDAGNTTVFIQASEVGLNGIEPTEDIENCKDVMHLIEEIRGQVCVKLGLVQTWQDAKKATPYQPFFAIISQPHEYIGMNNIHVTQAETDIVSRIIFMGHMHKAYPVSGTVATGAAARIEGSLVYDLLNQTARHEETLRIGHPSGIITIDALGDKDHNDRPIITKLSVARTARTIMDGIVYITT